MPYLGVLDSNFEKPLLYLKSTPLSLPYCKVWCKRQKSLNLGPKMPYLGIFGLEVENNNVIFEISSLELV